MSRTVHIERLCQGLPKAGSPCVNVLLVFGTPLGNAVGDTLMATNHFRFLKAAFCKIKLTVWTADSEIWHSTCGQEVECRPFISDDEVRHNFDLIVLDWVSLDRNIENLFLSHCKALINILPSLNGLRYFTSETGWTTLDLSPLTNQTQRLSRAYGALGVPVDFTGIEGAGGEGKVTLYLNPYASSAEKSFTATLFAHLLRELPKSWTRGPVLCPSVPDGVPASQLPYFLSLDALVKEAVCANSVRQLGRMKRSEYISRVRGSGLVIGPDTSTQHVAALYDIPCIACYPTRSGYKYYRWAPPGALSLCFDLPHPNHDEKTVALAELICHLTKVINYGIAKKQSKATLTEEFTKICKAVVFRTISCEEGKIEVSRILAELGKSVPESWRAFVIPELEQIATEVFKRTAEAGNGPDKLSLSIISDVFALKTVSLLDVRAPGIEKFG